MSPRHKALVIEDDRPSSEGLVEILGAEGCDSVVCDNKEDALNALRSATFCVVLLDLEIKGARDAIKGHTAHGESLLREMRTLFPERSGSSYWLPILVVSGFAREADTAVEVMKSGATDVIQKPLNSQKISSAVKGALMSSGRPDHTSCSNGPGPMAQGAAVTFSIAIPGERDRRRTMVLIGGRKALLPDSSLKVLLHLMVARLKSTGVHKLTLGAKDDQGFKGISRLRDHLGSAVNSGSNIIANDQHGNYRLMDEVSIGECNTSILISLGDVEIAALAQEMADLRNRI